MLPNFLISIDSNVSSYFASWLLYLKVTKLKKFVLGLKFQKSYLNKIQFRTELKVFNPL
jgi:hypothetical protein